MKILALAILTSFSFNLMAKSPVIIEAPIDHIFVPRGFDNNDNVELVVTGKFPNPCYSKNNYNVKIVNNVIQVNVSSQFMDDPPYTKCEPLSVPFTEIIKLGNLQARNYKVVVNGGGVYEQNDAIAITEASSQSIDDNFYPIIEYVETGFTGGTSGDALIIAQSPSSCLEFDHVEYLSNNKDSLSIMPILKKTSTICPEVKVKLEIPIKFDPSKFSFNQVLLYVRTIEGGSVNKIIER